MLTRFDIDGVLVEKSDPEKFTFRDGAAGYKQRFVVRTDELSGDEAELLTYSPDDMETLQTIAPGDRVSLVACLKSSRYTRRSDGRTAWWLSLSCVRGSLVGGKNDAPSDGDGDVFPASPKPVPDGVRASIDPLTVDSDDLPF